MARLVTDEEHRANVFGYYKCIETALELARQHMAAGEKGEPETIDMMLEVIGWQVERARRGSRWPNPAKRVAQAAKQDPALQNLIKRASNPTPIRATKKASIRAAQHSFAPAR